jgi:uncharacterized protein YndB with AHSA1/START domain
MTASAPAARPHERTVALTRFFAAPRARVFEAWTRAEQLAHWFGPRNFTAHSCEADARPGGVFRLCMRSPDGRDYWVRGSYRELVAPSHLVIDCVADDEHGAAMLEEVIRVTLTEQAGGTQLELKADAAGPGARAKAALEGMEQGWAQTIDRLSFCVTRS